VAVLKKIGDSCNSQCVYNMVEGIFFEKCWMKWQNGSKRNPTTENRRYWLWQAFQVEILPVGREKKSKIENFFIFHFSFFIFHFSFFIFHFFFLFK
jgi:hypothetical protein